MATKGVSALGLGGLATGVGLAGNALGLFGKGFNRTATWAEVPKRAGAELAKYGVQQTNLGIAIINTPPMMVEKYKLDKYVSGVASFIEGFSVPGRSIQTSDTRRYGVGPASRTPVGSTNQNTTTITVMGDSQGKYYKFFYLWMDNIVRTEGMDKSWETPNAYTVYPYEVSYLSDYSTSVEFIEADVRMEKVTETRLYKAFPISISEKQMNWNNTGMMTFTVEFAYAYSNVADLDKDVLKFTDPKVPTKSSFLAMAIKAGNALQLLRSIKSSGGSSAAGVVAAGASALGAGLFR